MDIIEDAIEVFKATEWSQEYCVQILNQQVGEEELALYDPQTRTILDSIHNALNAIKLVDNATECLPLKQLAAYAFIGLRAANDANVTMDWARVLVRICGLPGARAHSLVSANLLLGISTTIIRVVSQESKVLSNRRGTQTLRSSQDNDDDEDRSVDGFDDDEDALEGETQGRNGSNRHSLTPGALREILKDLSDSVTVFFNSSEVDTLDNLIDALVGIAFLSEIKSEFDFPECRVLLLRLATQNEGAMLSVYRSLMTGLMMAGRDGRVPDNVKSKIQCHRSAVKIVSALARTCSIDCARWVTASASESTIDSTDDEISNQPDSSLSPSRDAKSAKSLSSMTTPYACVIGALQRLTLCAPDRANIRNAATCSIVDILNSIYKIDGSSEEKVVADDIAAVRQYILFLDKLARCNRVGLRAFAVEIMAAVVNTEWIWSTATLHGISKEQALAVPKTIVFKLLDRCGDAAPTVRIRAVNALADLVAPFSEDLFLAEDEAQSQPDKCNFMLDLMLGMAIAPDDTIVEPSDEPDHQKSSELESPQAPGANRQVDKQKSPGKSYNLMETLRSRVHDDKPLVRSRAVTTFGTVLCVKWPKYSPSLIPFEMLDSSESAAIPTPTSHLQIEYVSMFVAEDDINILVERCDDVSVSVRKNAIGALSTLAKARPGDAMVLDAWVTAALPLIADSEASVQTKVAQCTSELILVEAVAWDRDMKLNLKQAQRMKRNQLAAEENEPMVQGTNTLAWQLLLRIAALGQVKLLRDGVQVLIKQQIILGAVSSNASGPHNRLRMPEILAAARRAACTALNDSSLDACGTEGIIGLRENDPEILSKAGWVLLEALVAHDKKSHLALLIKGETVEDGVDLVEGGLESADFVVESINQRQEVWTSDRQADKMDDNDVRILAVLQKVAHTLPLAKLNSVKAILITVLQSLKHSPDVITAATSALYALSLAPMAHIGEKRSTSKTFSVLRDCYDEIQRWSGLLLGISASVLSAYCWGDQKTAALALLQGLPFPQPTRTVASAIQRPESSELRSACNAALFLIGEIAMLGFSIEEDEARLSGALLSSTRNPSTLPVYAISEASSAFRVLIPDALVTLIQTCMAESIPRQSVEQVSADSVIDASESAISGSSAPEVRAFAFVSMGKLCLRSKTLAQNYVNVFLRELNPAATSLTSAALRSNALLVLGDLCVRYTHLIDRNVGQMAVCLQDDSHIVRKHAIVLLTQLLLQDFLKWRGLLLFRFLASAIDEHPELAEFARIVLKKTILTKHPDFFCQHFSEAVVVFCGWTTHPSYIAAQYSGSEGDSCAVTMDGVNFSGPGKRHSRMKLFNFMMDEFTEEQKIHVTAKLVDDILAYIIDSNALSGGSTEARWSCEETLEDVLAILKSPLLKVGKKSESSEEGGLEDEEGDAKSGANAAVAKAKSVVLKKLSRQHLVSHVLPVVTSLKHVLETNKSSAQGALMDYLLFLLKWNKAEVEQALANDPCLKNEIAYDLKQHQKAKEMAAMQRHASQVVDSVQRDRLSSAKKREVGVHLADSPTSRLVHSSRRGSTSRSNSPSTGAGDSLQELAMGLQHSIQRLPRSGPASATSASVPRTPRQALASVGKTHLINASADEDRNNLIGDSNGGDDFADRLATSSSLLNSAMKLKSAGSWNIVVSGLDNIVAVDDGVKNEDDGDIDQDENTQGNLERIDSSNPVSSNSSGQVPIKRSASEAAIESDSTDNDRSIARSHSRLVAKGPGLLSALESSMAASLQSPPPTKRANHL